MYSGFQNEVLLLREVYPGDCLVSSSPDLSTVTISINHGRGFTVHSNINVTFTLHIECSSQYPLESPRLSISHVHGLNSRDIMGLEMSLDDLIKERRGEHILFEVVDFCREFIANNIPTVDCAICLQGFKTEDEVYRTLQFHYFHKLCVGKYMLQQELDHTKVIYELHAKDPFCKLPVLFITCPVCRVEVLPYSDALVNCARGIE
ncbi:hypothetical protein EG68_09005 [Paragonimus skrjabini miyazakii]|uniref:RWD domain-containing protein n=1 Tax=Paragonimus skrjabini miyazakii TaxID=59628 RepID=A0A8S9YRB7_9TREM|nr:hypothetical protein EG68_09005 [Paragonimus skrjabini miyazakii]